MEGEAAVAGAVLMPALIAGAGIAEQDRAGRKHRRALACPVAERALGYRGNAKAAMLFLERAVADAGGAHDVRHLPAPARDDFLLTRRHRPKVSNFPQAQNPFLPLLVVLS